MLSCSRLALLVMAIAAIALGPCDATSPLAAAADSVVPRAPKRVPAASSSGPKAPSSATGAIQPTDPRRADYGVFLPKECYDSDGGTQPCILLWHAGTSGKPSNSLWAIITRQPIGHVALWIGGSDVKRSTHNADDKQNYASWWPAGDGAEASKSDLSGPASPHSYKQDLATTGEGRPPDQVLSLVGWDSKRMKDYYHEVILPAGQYKLVGRNCVCTTFDLLDHGFADPSTTEPGKHREIAAKAFEELTTGWHRMFKPQTPLPMHDFIEAYSKLHPTCPYCNGHACTRRSIPPPHQHQHQHAPNTVTPAADTSATAQHLG